MGTLLTICLGLAALGFAGFIITLIIAGKRGDKWRDR